jgi:hypothetical protein
MGPRPVAIFQNSSPSDSSCTRRDVQSAGFGLSATAAAPSPLPRAPWQETQLIFATFSPWSTVFLSLGAGFFFAFSDPGAAHGVLCAGVGGGGRGERPHQGGPQYEAASADGARHDHPTSCDMGCAHWYRLVIIDETHLI